MLAAAADRQGGPEVLQVREVPQPRVGPDEVLVLVVGSSLNPVGHKLVRGTTSVAFPVVWPLIAGWTSSGEAIATGPAVRHVQVGQPVRAQRMIATPR